MTDRRKPGTGSSNAALLQAAAAARAQAYAQMNMNPAAFQAYQQQQQQQQQPLKGMVAMPHPATPNRQTKATTPSMRGYASQKSPVSSKMGIKSGMTVEDLKRLTQQRMQQASHAMPQAATSPATTASTSEAGYAPPTRAATPTLNMNAVNASAPMVPKMGMSVQELKQLTTLRLASQNVQAMHQGDISGLVSKAVLTNAAKSHYRDSLRGTLTPSSTPKRGGVTGPATPVRMAPTGMNVNHHMASPAAARMRPSNVKSGGFTRTAVNMNRYGGYEYVPTSYDPSMNESSYHHHHHAYQQAQEQMDDPDEDEEDEYERNPLQFPDDAFPPPPPMDDHGGFVATSMPSWSPPPTKSKKLETIAPPPVPFYSQQTYFNQQPSSTKEDAAKDQNAIIAPPPGLARRPSMTVPWQVAEAVLNTPQMTGGANRKQLLSPKLEPETSNMFGGMPAKLNISRGESTGLKSDAAEAAAQLGALTTQLVRQRSGSIAGASGAAAAAAAAAAATASSAVPGPTGVGAPNAGARRGSFGNAAEFFKFRRRSKSRLELARDLAEHRASMFPNYGSTTMPGIDERRADGHDNFSVVAHADTVSEGSSSSSSDDENDEDEEIVALRESFDEADITAGNFVSFYHATQGQAARTRARKQSMDALSNLSIPPPPPPPMDDDQPTDDQGLPMMSPNGVKLRKVAEMARRGSLSNEDKTRVKDEIIQSSLGIGASNAARIFSSKMPPAAQAASDPSRPPVSPSVCPPPGFQRLGSTPVPPRDPMASGTKASSIPAGIVRSTSIGVARSPPKPALQLSPTTMRKTVTVTQEKDKDTSGSLEERLAFAAQRVADCVSKGDMVGFQQAMDQLDRLRKEANSMMQA